MNSGGGGVAIAPPPNAGKNKDLLFQNNKINNAFYGF